MNTITTMITIIKVLIITILIITERKEKKTFIVSLIDDIA